MQKLARDLFVCLSVVVALGCSGTETGNPGSQIELAISARTTDATRVSVGDQASALRVDSALISFHDIVVLSCSGEVTAELTNTVVDLTESGAMQFSLDASSGEACGIRFDVAPAAGDAGLLGDYSVVLGGVRSDGAPFEVDSLLETTITLSSTAGFDAERLILAFDLAVWLDPDEVHGAVLHEDVAQISDQANPELLAAIDARLELSAELFVDEDGDGQLDAGESDPVAQAE